MNKFKTHYFIGGRRTTRAFGATGERINQVIFGDKNFAPPRNSFLVTDEKNTLNHQILNH